MPGDFREDRMERKMSVSRMAARLRNIENRLIPPDPRKLKVYIGISPDDWPGPKMCGKTFLFFKTEREYARYLEENG